MSLYGDLPQAKTGTEEAATPSGSETSSWSSQLFASNTKRPAFSVPSSALRAPQKTGNLLPRRQPAAAKGGCMFSVLHACLRRP